ncbi:probable ion channel POLLUX isoform X2 [Elaeis guineensis]|uniref:probable ion channel POLLUX isoform X2 n=1 Tax=Elaeis guineensis var. tenera TaxID=51953 RepID=UPI003C6D4AE6
MPESDGGASQSSNPTPGPSPNPSSSPRNGESAPQLKKSRTISAGAGAVFPGPLHPAVRRSSTAPLPPPRRLTVAIDDPSDAPPNAGAFDREWCFPSFLGPYPSRPRTASRTPAGARPSSATRRTEFPPRLPDQKGPAWAAKSPDRTLARVSEVEKRKEAVKRPLVLEERRQLSLPSSTSAASDRGAALRFDNSLILLLLLVVSVSCALFALSQRKRVLELEQEINNVPQLCRGNGVDSDDGGKILQPEDRNSVSHFGNIDGRTVVLYTVVISLATPFFLFKCLDHLPRLKTPSKSLKNNEEEAPLKKRIAYRVDVFFSMYPYAKLLALLFATVLLIGFGGLALYAVSDASLSEALWLSWTFVADSGNHADQNGLGPRIVSVSISSGGMLIFAMMLGLVSDAISEKVDSWRKGKSEVIESNHILILGWSDKLGSLVKQLAIANKSLGGGVVVVLAERDKEEMEMDIAKLEFDFMKTSVICRSGSPLILADLKKVSVSKARAIIVLAADENADQSDARALRVVLSLTGVKEGLRGHVVVEMSDLDNEPLVKLVGGELIETVVAHDVIGRLMIQCALQPGLAQIWEDILGFENAEFYIKRWPQLDGMHFEDVLVSFPDAVPCGVKVAANDGKIIINPDDNYVLKDGDEILVIAEDDDTYAPGPLPEVLEAFLAPNSELWLFNEVPEKEREKKLTDGGLDLLGLTNIKLVHKEGNAVIRRI